MKKFIYFLTASLLIISACQKQNTNKTTIIKTEQGYQLLHNGKSYFIRGAGADGYYKEAAWANANSIRTWGVDQWDEAFRNAEKYDLTVFAGLWLDQERQGFDYSNPDTVKQQFDRLKKAILKYKDHPNLLMWGVGNEVDLNYTNHEVWYAVEQVAKFIKKVDGNHPVTTTTAFIDSQEVALIKERCPSLDLLSINTYAALPAVNQYLKEFGWDKAYILGEWGTKGHWEVARTKWDEPIEMTSKEKANLYYEGYQKHLKNIPNCLGSYVFLWGSKQERTPTWYSMFLPDGAKTRAVDVMYYLWNGKWPENRSPILDSLRIDGKSAYSDIIITPNSSHQAQVWIREPDQDPITIEWEILHETRDKRTGGDEENKPSAADYKIIKQDNQLFKFSAPQKGGAYRLFVYVYDGKGSGAHANIPFYVKK
jgi:hypothetical protein